MDFCDGGNSFYIVWYLPVFVV